MTASSRYIEKYSAPPRKYFDHFRTPSLAGSANRTLMFIFPALNQIYTKNSLKLSSCTVQPSPHIKTFHSASLDSDSLTKYTTVKLSCSASSLSISSLSMISPGVWLAKTSVTFVLSSGLNSTSCNTCNIGVIPFTEEVLGGGRGGGVVVGGRGCKGCEQIVRITIQIEDGMKRGYLGDGRKGKVVQSLSCALFCSSRFDSSVKSSDDVAAIL